MTQKSNLYIVICVPGCNKKRIVSKGKELVLQQLQQKRQKSLWKHKYYSYVKVCFFNLLTHFMLIS